MDAAKRSILLCTEQPFYPENYPTQDINKTEVKNLGVTSNVKLLHIYYTQPFGLFRKQITKEAYENTVLDKSELCVASVKQTLKSYLTF